MSRLFYDDVCSCEPCVDSKLKERKDKKESAHKESYVQVDTNNIVLADAPG